MTPQSSPYWQSVQAAMATTALPDMQPGSVRYMTSLPKLLGDPYWKAGVVVGIAGENKKLAAQRLVEGTHRPSTPEEIEEYTQRMRRQGDELALQEAQRQVAKTGILKLSVSELEKLGRV